MRTTTTGTIWPGFTVDAGYAITGFMNTIFVQGSSFWAEEFDWKYLNDMAEPEEPESNNGHEERSIEVVCLTLGC